MLAVMTDAFEEVITAARRELDAREGRHVSTNELARRAGISESVLNYHLGRTRTAKARRPNREIARKLAPVLGVSEADLMRAWTLAAGFQVTEELPGNFGQVVVRYLEDATPEERNQLLIELSQILADEVRRSRERDTPNNGNRE